MKEIWDAYYADGSLAHCDLVRDEPIPQGLYHLVSEILVRHEDGDYLLMQRDPNKRGYPGWFEATAGGSALKGENHLACALRELREETGITKGVLSYIGESASENTLYHSYLCVTACDKSSITLQDGETVGYKWISEAEFAAFAKSEQIIPVQQKRLMPYLQEKGYI